MADAKIRLIFIVFSITAVLICTVYLRNAQNRTVYEIYKTQAQINRLKQQLGQKQLRLEQLINPASIYQKIEKTEK